MLLSISFRVSHLEMVRVCARTHTQTTGLGVSRGLCDGCFCANRAHRLCVRAAEERVKLNTERPEVPRVPNV